MTSDEAPATEAARAALAAAGIALDPQRGELTRPDGQRSMLRRQSMAVLLALASRAGRVVSQRHLLEAVWPGRVVTRDSLVQCVLEIRRALGACGGELLKTLPRRGYLLDLPPSAQAAQGAGHARLDAWPSTLPAAALLVHVNGANDEASLLSHVLKCSAKGGLLTVAITCLQIEHRPTTAGLAFVMTGEVHRAGGAPPASERAQFDGGTHAGTRGES